MSSCSGTQETPESVAQEWCKLNLKVNTAATVGATETATKERDNFIAEVKEKHKSDEAFIAKLEAAILKCNE